MAAKPSGLSMPPPGQAPSQPPSRVGGPPALCRFKLQGESRMDDPLRHGGGSTQLGESSKCSSHASRQFWLGRAVESGPTGAGMRGGPRGGARPASIGHPVGPGWGPTACMGMPCRSLRKWRARLPRRLQQGPVGFHHPGGPLGPDRSRSDLGRMSRQWAGLPRPLWSSMDPNACI